MPRDSRNSLRVVAVPTPRSGSVLFAAVFSVGVHALALAAFWGRPVIDLRAISMRLGAVLGVELISADDARPARAIHGSLRPRRSAEIPPEPSGQLAAESAPVKLHGPDLEVAQGRLRKAAPEAVASPALAVPRTDAAARAISEIEAGLAAAGVTPASPERKPLSERLGPPPAEFPRSSLAKPKLTLPDAGRAAKRLAEPARGDDHRKALPGRFSPKGGAGAGAAGPLRMTGMPAVEVTAKAVDAGQLGRWVLFEMRIGSAEVSFRPAAKITAAFGAPAALDPAAAASVRASLGSPPKVEFARASGMDGLVEAMPGGASLSPGPWILAVSGPTGGNDLASLQKLLGKLPKGRWGARIFVVELSAAPSYALGWLARRSGGAYRHAASAPAAAGAAAEAAREIRSLVLDFQSATITGGRKAPTVPAVPPAVFGGRKARFLVPVDRPEPRVLAVLKPSTSAGVASLPLAASGKLPAAGADAAKEIAQGELDRLMELAARSGLSDELRARISALAARHSLTPPRFGSSK